MSLRVPLWATRVVLAVSVEGWSSRYADPEADGTSPVCRKILRGVDVDRWRVGRCDSVLETKRGADVPPAGALVRRRSAMVIEDSRLVSTAIVWLTQMIS